MHKPLVEDDPSDQAEEYNRPSFRHGGLIKLAALLTLLAFVAFSLSDLSYLFGPRLNFLNQNSVLLNDPLVVKSRPAVVAIETTVLSNPLQAAVHRGTGFNIDPRGIIITNQHVVDSGQGITITFSDGRRFMVRDYETIPGQDLAIIKLNSSDLPSVTLDKDDRVLPGEVVTIIGNPLGLQKIAQRGAVISRPSPWDGQPAAFVIDVVINHGNSGSPVINEQGKVIGVVFASLSRQENGATVSRALAIPVQNLLRQL